jgi:acetate kinase
VDPVCGVISDLSEIGAIGHRIVHGGEKFAKATVITPEVIEGIEECSELAPLHNPANLIGVRACQELMPGVPMVAVFDTAFHQTMPKQAYLYGIAHEYYEKYGIRRYGFHGTSHSYVSKRAAEMLGKKPEEVNVIVCHLGNGSSICAVKQGKSIDTTMGLTPLEGLPMGTRSGNLDPTIISFLVEKEHLNLEQVMDILNKHSGMAGMSGVSSDFRDLDDAATAGNQLADEALEVFCYDIAKFIGG